MATPSDIHDVFPAARDGGAPYPHASYPQATYPQQRTPLGQPVLTGRAERTRWTPMAATALVAALLASGGTVAVTSAFDEPTAAPAAATAPRTDASGPVDAAAAGPDWATVAAALQDSVVAIGARASTGSGEGSGVAIDDRGHVLTNHHVVAGAVEGGSVTVTTADGSVLEAEVVGTDPTTDLAVLKVEQAELLQPIAIGNSDQVTPGQPVMAAGNPLGLSDTVTTGIVSATDRPVTTQADTGATGISTGPTVVVTNAIQTDAAVNPGNSGGALVDATGALIGINSAIASLGSKGQAGSIGLGFAIPVNEAMAVAEQILADGRAEQTYLGVTLASEVVPDGEVGRQAAVVGEILPGTPAAESGLEPGDAVAAVDGEPVSGAESLTARVRERRPGDVVSLELLRDGERRTVQVTLAERPSEQG